MAPAFVIEHLDKEIFPWTLLEFKHILSTVPHLDLRITNVTVDEDAAKLQPLGCRVEPASVEAEAGGRDRMCILDPRAADRLAPGDGAAFDAFVFGGILGNHPMDGRTERELSSRLSGAARRHLGDVQMTTDTAVLVAHRIVVGKVPFEKLRFVDFPEIPLGGCEVTEMPFRYLTDEAGAPLLPPGMVALWKEDVTLDPDDIQW